MIKKFLLSSILFLSIAGLAQESTASPYSIYGIGEEKFNGTNENKSMGGIGILPDSIHINLQNSASLADLKLTSFAIGATYNTVTFKNASESEKARRTGLDYLAVALPLGKFGVSFGLKPISSVGYNIQKIDVSQIGTYTGTGGVSKAFVGAGYKLNSKFSIGADFGYNFGTIETNNIVNRFVQNNTQETNTSELSGITLNTSMLFQTKIKKYDFITSFTFTPATSLKSRNSRIIQIGSILSSPFVVTVPDSDIKIPSKVAFGAGIGEVRKWFVGFESTFKQSSGFENLFSTLNNATYEDGAKFALGGYYNPKNNAYSNYLRRITYRAGLRYENTGLVVNTKAINDRALTLGFGLPSGISFSNINLGFEFGKRGTTALNLIEENYLNVSIGLSFSDKWFVKRKFD